MTGHIHYQETGAADRRIAHLILHHEGKFNAMSREMWRALRQRFESIARDDGLRCVVVRGAQGHFCAGGDISEYPSFRFDPVALRAFHEDEVWGALHAMLQCDVPLVAHIEGNCMGAGLEIASCCDIRLAGQSARFGAPIARLGFPMAPKEAALVTGAVGHTTAKAMLLSAAVFDAPHMLARDFLTYVLPEPGLEGEVDALAQRIASLAPAAARMNKRTLRSMNMPLPPVDSVECAMNFESDHAVDTYAYAGSFEHREGIAAFLEKRPPSF
ncbi:enoyl-CoA hydratase/isomerase family protein [Rhodoferax aquaticus]|uniref:Enoyl-CoA hydratase/isomerase family protein n=1 Tax=Rhodoferax aquaticus TaxID=2527691 RepID=A0A515EQ91_9BURK|nr:enoyl-CoA hydratase-related protein [Rhodoferax aquaticus]QDL54833.1 enoyl-CoA hydratase/isomerase family protein [Rhodoferax aquaticus]